MDKILLLIFWATRYIFTTDRPTYHVEECVLNGDISTAGHPIHFMFGSRVGFLGRQIERIYFRLNQIQEAAAGREFEWPCTVFKA